MQPKTLFQIKLFLLFKMKNELSTSIQLSWFPIFSKKEESYKYVFD